MIYLTHPQLIKMHFLLHDPPGPRINRHLCITNVVIIIFSNSYFVVCRDDKGIIFIINYKLILCVSCFGLVYLHHIG